jgi:uncharacterized protein
VIGMTTTEQSQAPQSDRLTGIRGFAGRRPITTFLIIVLAMAWPAFGIPILLGFPTDPSKLLVTLVVMIGTASLVTSWADGRAGVRNLFAGVTRWRIGVGYYLLVLAAMPALTIAVALASGTFQQPDGGWLKMIGTYLLATIVIGALILNLWEETAWSGFVQSRLMARHGLLTGSMLTAIPFIAIHLPLVFEGEHVTLGTIALSWVALAGTAFFLRYVIGTVFLDTSGSLIAAGLLHASFNNSQSLAVLRGDAWWQNIVAVVLLTGLIVAYRSYRGLSPISAERADADR